MYDYFTQFASTIDFPRTFHAEFAADAEQTASGRKRKRKKTKGKSICLFVLRSHFPHRPTSQKKGWHTKWIIFHFNCIGREIMSVRGVNSVTFVHLSSTLNRLT